MEGQGEQSTGGAAGPEPVEPRVSDLAILDLRTDMANAYSELLDLIVYKPGIDQ